MIESQTAARNGLLGRRLSPVVAGAVLVAISLAAVGWIALGAPVKLPETLLSADGYRVTLSADAADGTSRTYLVTERDTPEVFHGVRRTLSQIELDPRVSARLQSVQVGVHCTVEPLHARGEKLWLHPAPVARVEDGSETTTYRTSSSWYAIVRGLAVGSRPESDEELE